MISLSNCLKHRQIWRSRQGEEGGPAASTRQKRQARYRVLETRPVQASLGGPASGCKPARGPNLNYDILILLLI